MTYLSNLIFNFHAIVLKKIPLMLLTASLPVITSSVHAEEIETSSKTTVYEGNRIRMFVPHSPLAYGSVQIEPLRSIQHFNQMTEEEHLESYQSMQKIITVWKQNDEVNAYLIYAKDSLDEENHSFHFELVPFYKNDWSFVKQVKILWNICFGSSSLGLQKRINLSKHYSDHYNDKNIDMIESSEKTDDAFCHPEVIDKQSIFSSQRVNVLYNYAPIGFGDKKWHFLFTTKEHHQFFDQIDSTEYLETIILINKVSSYFKEQQQAKTMYLFHKSGIEAGQTVPHWHAHLIFSPNTIHDLLSKFYFLKNMICPSSPLPLDELQQNVRYFKQEFEPLSNN